MTRIDEDPDEVEARVNRRLRVAGVVAILAAAVGSMTAATSATAPATDDSCSMSLADGLGFSHSCAEQAVPASAE